MWYKVKQQDHPELELQIIKELKDPSPRLIGKYAKNRNHKIKIDDVQVIARGPHLDTKDKRDN